MNLERLQPMEALGNARAVAGEIRVERIEKRFVPRVPFPHRHDFFHFIALEKGAGWHEIDFQRFPVNPPQLFLVKPGAIHTWDLSASTRGYVLEFTESSIGNREEVAQLLEALGRITSVLEGKAATALLPLLALMKEEYCTGAPGFRLSLEHLLVSLLIQLARQVPQAAASVSATSESLVARFRALVEQNFKTRHSVEFYAMRLGVSAKALSTRIARSLGKSAGAVIQERCLVEAKRLLAYSSLPVSDIAYRLGYDDPNYFSRFYRGKTGLAPGAFRKLATHSRPH